MELGAETEVSFLPDWTLQLTYLFSGWTVWTLNFHLNALNPCSKGMESHKS